MSDKIEKRLAEIEARAKCATEGLWQIAWLAHEGCSVVQTVSGAEVVRCPIPSLQQDDANANCIAHARDDLPWLVGQVRMLRQFVRNHCGVSNAFDMAVKEHGDLLAKLADS